MYQLENFLSMLRLNYVDQSFHAMGSSMLLNIKIGKFFVKL